MCLELIMTLVVGYDDYNDCHALCDDKCLDHVSMSTFIDSADKCKFITSARLNTMWVLSAAGQQLAYQC